MASQFGERQQVREQVRLAIPRFGRAGMVVLAVAIPVLIFHLLPTSRLQAVFVLAAIYAVVTYSLSLLYHNAGMLSAAHGALMAIGAYTSALVAIHFGWGFWASLGPAIVMSAIAGMVVGFPVARARGHYFLLLTFAFGSLVVVLLQNLKSLTQGDQGLQILDVPGSIGPIDFAGLTNQFYLAFGFAVAAAACVWGVSRSPLGSRLASIRENEHLARSLGLNVQLYKVLAFGISGAIAGVGGVLYLYQQTVIVPDSFTVLASIQFIIMVVLGGRSLLGPAVGVLVISLIPEMIGLDPQNRQLAYGVVLTAIVLLLPRGVVPALGDGIRRALAAWSLTSRTLMRQPAIAVVDETAGAGNVPPPRPLEPVSGATVPAARSGGKP